MDLSKRTAETEVRGNGNRINGGESVGKRGGLAKRSQGIKNTLLSHEILTHDLLHDMKLLHVHYIQ